MNGLEISNLALIWLNQKIEIPFAFNANSDLHRPRSQIVKLSFPPVTRTKRKHRYPISAPQDESSRLRTPRHQHSTVLRLLTRWTPSFPMPIPMFTSLRHGGPVRVESDSGLDLTKATPAVFGRWGRPYSRWETGVSHCVLAIFIGDLAPRTSSKVSKRSRFASTWV